MANTVSVLRSSLKPNLESAFFEVDGKWTTGADDRRLTGFEPKSEFYKTFDTKMRCALLNAAGVWLISSCSSDQAYNFVCMTEKQLNS